MATQFIKFHFELSSPQKRKFFPKKTCTLFVRLWRPCLPHLWNQSYHILGDFDNLPFPKISQNLFRLASGNDIVRGLRPQE